MWQVIPLGLEFNTSTEKGVSLSKDKHRFSCMKTQHLLNYGKMTLRAKDFSTS